MRTRGIATETVAGTREETLSGRNVATRAAGYGCTREVDESTRMIRRLLGTLGRISKRDG